ncbi:MAG TPA: DUF3306 domain-containing protein, partial [Burkholderiaceae bacterium]
MAEQASGFLSRWARRKEAARAGESVAPEPVAPATTLSPLPESIAPTVVVEPAVDGTDLGAQPVGTAPAAEPAPTMADVALLGRASDYSRFVASGVDEGVKRAAMKKLFADPHFNVMDGLDTYIDDYGQPDPIPLAMLRRMNQSKSLHLFDDDDNEGDQNKPEPLIDATAATAAEPTKPPDDDPDLRLQQD